jgi:murein L,D-transpeptidase YcbB/YkuD
LFAAALQGKVPAAGCFWFTGWGILFLAAMLCLPAVPGRAADPWEQVRERLKTELSLIKDTPRPFCRRELLCGSEVLCCFYKSRDYRPVWLDDRGPLPQARSLVDTIRQADREGLKADVYHLSVVEPMLQKLEAAKTDEGQPDPDVLADLDLLLTDAFLLYGSHLLAGRVNPETINPRWGVASRQRDLTEILISTLERDGSIRKALEGMLPSHEGYPALREVLARYREIARNGGWPRIPSGPMLRPGDRDERIPLLRERLLISNDLRPGAPDSGGSDFYNPYLEQAVKQFQSRHGLFPDGVVGPATLAALNVSVEWRIRQIELNMERWRWLPEELGRRFVLVNTADFYLEVVEDDELRFFMKIIAGRKARRTPVFSGRITYLVINPYWNIPHKIAVRDLLPKIQADPEYLQRESIRILESWKEDAPEIDPKTVDWSSITKWNLSFRFRQDPGPRNALGRIKFIFPNKFAVYLHDTPSHHLFQKIRRSFSSGCIRIEKPYLLAEYLLASDPRWSREKLVEAVESRKNRVVKLRESVPVYLLYWTAWMDGKGQLQFREDVYGRDPALYEALIEGPTVRPSLEPPPADRGSLPEPPEADAS